MQGHVRLPPGIFQVDGTIVDSARWHGTAVLGIVCGLAHLIGCRGIAPKVEPVLLSSSIDANNEENIHNAVMTAIDRIKAKRKASSGGGVLLLETQEFRDHAKGTLCVPIEVKDTIFDLIEDAIKAGITVVEAAGNGDVAESAAAGIDLDKPYIDAIGNCILNPITRARDSGAIMVGAGLSQVSVFPVNGSNVSGHRRLQSSNYGSRLDCYAWGQNVVTFSTSAATPFPINTCIDDFSETSAAAAIIAGVALVVQGVRTAEVIQPRLTPAKLRQLLSSKGTPCKPGRNIGVMPDLKKIMAARPW